MTVAFETWLGTRPKWLQTAASNLLSRQSLPDEQAIERLADLCITEVNGVTSGFSSVSTGAFDVEIAGSELRIREIKSIEGVNALDPGAALDFGDANIVVVYGRNGTGKSGFARLTKHAAGDRSRTGLLPDVFTDHAPAPRASFIIEREGKATTQEWTLASGAVNTLQHVHVFDREVARHYLTAKAEASYEPRRLRFLSSLVTICEAVKANLESRKFLLPSSMPNIPLDLVSTELAALVTGLRASQKPEAVTKSIARSPDHTVRVKALQVALGAQDPATRIKGIAAELKALEIVRKMVDTIDQGLSEEKVTEVATAQATAKAAREAATQAAGLAFDQALLPDVGDATWQAMWEAARAYSTQIAYPGCSFPHVEQDSKCPLCHQVLDEPATMRLASFEAFVKGDVESKAKAAEAKHQAAVKALPTIPAEADWLAHFARVPDAEQLAKVVWSAATARRSDLAESVVTNAPPALDACPLLDLVNAQVDTLTNEAELLKKAQEGTERSKMEAELLELRMLDWCADNREAILAELDRLMKIAILDKSIKKTSTAALTKKKGELAQEELTGGYQSRFATELKALGAESIRVMPIEAGRRKGKINFTLSIVGAKNKAEPAGVLSEGEARVVALATFLADVTVAGARTPFVFDDPISSLDQEFEERVVARLLKLAGTRQVLVFTHRLSLLVLLRDGVRKERQTAKAVVGGTSVTMREIALRRIGTRVGLVTETNVLESKVDKALNDLINRRLVNAKKLADAGEVDEYTAAMKAVCSDIRILTERAIEEELLNGVVLRFRRSVTTMNKLPALAKISSADCAMLDDIMTRYSCFEHSQPAESPAPIPEFERVKEDATILRDWVIEFHKRLVDPEVA